MRRLFALFLVSLFLANAFAAEERITLNFVNADIQSVIKTVGEHTGKNFILDPRVTGNVTIVSPTPVPRADLYPIFLSTLRSNGFAAVEQNGFVRIVPEPDAKTAASPSGAAALAAKGDRIVTYVFSLQHESAAQLVTTLRPLVAANNYIAAYPSGNAIIITDYAENVKRIQRIIESVDQPTGGETQVIRMQHAQAADIAALLARVVPELGTNPATPGALPRAQVAVDARTNSLIVRSDGGSVMQRVKKLAAQLDQPAGATQSQVVYLKNADATQVAETLRALMAGQAAAPVPVAPAAGTPAAAAVTAAPAASPPSMIQAFKETNSLIIAAPEAVTRNLLAVIQKLDTRRAQVYIEALIAEVTGETAAELGIQWQGLSGLGNSNTNVVGGTNFSTSTTAGANILSASQNITGVGPGLNIGVVNGTVRIPGTNLDILNLGVLAKALETHGRGNILSVPGTLTLDNQEANITVGQNIPVVTGSYTVQSSGVSSPFQTIERRDVGLKLKVKPQIAEGGTIKLSIAQEVSSLAGTTSGASRDVILNKRAIESTVLVEDGSIIVLGGLMQDDTGNSTDQVPLLGDLPLIGQAFRYNTRKRSKTNLMVFIRPFVLKDAAASKQFSDERYEYIRSSQQAAQPAAHPVLPDTSATVLPGRK
jgi:general secretion pathway protein D